MNFVLTCCSCASCAFVFLPPVRDADVDPDVCEDLAFCGDLAVDVERPAVVLPLVFDCEPLLYVLLFPVATVCTPSLFPHSPITIDIFPIQSPIWQSASIYKPPHGYIYVSLNAHTVLFYYFSLHLSSHINNSLPYECRPSGR